MKIRLMQPADIQAAMSIDTESFKDLREKLSGRPVECIPREREYLEFWLTADANGALVAEHEGQIVGINLNHVRGKIGWFGPLAVKTSEQSAGIGKMLLHHGVEYLKTSGCELIGLDTFPNNPVAVSMYIKYGFRIVGATVLLEVPFAELHTPEPSALMHISEIKSDDLPHIARREEKLTGFDRRKDFEFIVSWGDGFGLCASHRQRIVGWVFGCMKRRRGMLGVLHIDEESTEQLLPAFLHEAADQFKQRGADKMGILCDGRQVELMNLLFSFGFRTTSTMVKFILGDERQLVPHCPLSLEQG